MALKTQFKLPSLKEFLSRNKEAYTAAQELGVIRMVSWEEQESILTREWHIMKQMSKSACQNYMQARYQRELPALQQFKAQLDKLIDTNNARNKAGESLRDAKAQEKHARKKRSAR